jgi:hypothetical protein
MFVLNALACAKLAPPKPCAAKRASRNILELYDPKKAPPPNQPGGVIRRAVQPVDVSRRRFAG